MKKLFFALLAVAIACSDSTGPTKASVAGTWTLQSINGVTLPVVIDQSLTSKLEITGDVLTVSSSGSFTQATSFRLTQNNVVQTQTIPDAGSYVLSGSTVTFQFQSDGSTGTGTLNGNTMTVTAGGSTYIYMKQ